MKRFVGYLSPGIAHRSITRCALSAKNEEAVVSPQQAEKLVFVSRYGHCNEILQHREEIDINFSEDQPEPNDAARLVLFRPRRN